MASGFLILGDGRCFSVRWGAYDQYLLAIADELVRSPEEVALGNWLRSLVPTDVDIEEIGHGPWVRAADGKIMGRTLDVRELAPRSQRFFEIGAQRAFTRLKLGQGSRLPPNWLERLQRLMTMFKYARQGRPIAAMSDWREGYVEPATGRTLGRDGRETERRESDHRMNALIRPGSSRRY